MGWYTGRKVHVTTWYLLDRPVCKIIPFNIIKKIRHFKTFQIYWITFQVMYKHYVFLFLLFIYNWHLPNKEETLKSRRFSIFWLSFSIIFHFFLVKFLFFLLCNYRVWFDLYSLTHAILCIRCIQATLQKKCLYYVGYQNSTLCYVLPAI